jgi:hypothetical protein
MRVPSPKTLFRPMVPWIAFRRLCTVVLLLIASAFSQSRPRIDFDRLLSLFPNLPWDFEIRLVEKDLTTTDMMRIYYDRRVDVVRWRPEYPGSLASVCHSNIDYVTMQRILTLLRDKKFNDLPSGDGALVTVAQKKESTVSVRLGKTVVRKTIRDTSVNRDLDAIANDLRALKVSIVADPKSTCELESVPAAP